MKRIAMLLVMIGLIGLTQPPALAAPAQPDPRDAVGRTGTILAEYWEDVAGGDVNDLIHSPGFPDDPTIGQLLGKFEIPVNRGENYGARVRGFICPPVTGEYTFWIASDDGGELHLSPSADPAAKRKIAFVNGWTGSCDWDRSPDQKSKPIKLEAGKRYYIEALHKQGGGEANLAVGWRLPDGAMERPIPGNRLSPAAAPKPRKPEMPVTVTLNPATPVAKTFGHHKFPLDADVQGRRPFKMSYLLFLPKEYPVTQRRMPMLVFLCGNSHQGSDLGGILNEGPAQFLDQDAKLREWFPMVALFPQPPDGTRWDTRGMPQAVAALVQEIVKKYRIDADRVYLTGLSMGGKGTWLVSQCAPRLFAAIAPISAVSVDPDQAPAILRNVPTWIICGSDDGDFTEGSKKMFQSLHAAGNAVELTVVPHEGHGVWDHYYPTRPFYEKMMRFTRKPATGQTQTPPRPEGAAPKG